MTVIARNLVVITLVPIVAVGAAATVPPAPPVQPAGPMLVSWSLQDVRCGDAQPAVVRAPDPAPSLSYGDVDRASVVPVRFRIDGRGQPLGIARSSTDFVAYAGDLLPALAATRFAPGPVQPACTARFVAARAPLASAPIEQAWQYSLQPDGTPPRQLWQRVWSQGGNCGNPSPAPLLRAFPNYKAMAGSPGRREWAMLRYDLDGAGRPIAIRVAGGSGDPALGTAAVSATAASRFEEGERTGCLMPFVRAAAPLLPPEPPSEESLRPEGATCPRELPYVRQPTLTFPDAYRRRAIEGWAVLAFDVAPWGEIGNMRVLGAEPTAEFGDWAKRVIGGATKSPSTTGYVGCVDRVLFKLGPTEKLIVLNDKPA